MLANGGACFRHAPSVLSTGEERNKNGRRSAGGMQPDGLRGLEQAAPFLQTRENGRIAAQVMRDAAAVAGGGKRRPERERVSGTGDLQAQPQHLPVSPGEYPSSGR